MKQKVTIKDIARQTGTSVASVHRAIYGKEGISKALCEKILKEVEKTHYTMDEAASTLRRGEYHIAVLLPKAVEEERFFFSGLWDGIYKSAETLKKNKVNVSFIASDYGVKDISVALRELYDETDADLNGLITICDDEESQEWIARFIRRGTKVALIDKGLELENLSCCMKASTVDMGNLAGDVVGLFLAGKKGTIIAVNGTEKRVSYKVYINTFKERIKETCPGCDLIVLDGFDVEGSVQKIRELLPNGKNVAIMACCARATYHVCNVLEGLEMKERPLVIGTDIFEELEEFFDNGILTASIYQSHREQGGKALEILYDCLANPNSADTVCQEPVVPIGLVMKENYKYYI